MATTVVAVAASCTCIHARIVLAPHVHSSRNLGTKLRAGGNLKRPVLELPPRMKYGNTATVSWIGRCLTVEQYFQIFPKHTNDVRKSPRQGGGEEELGGRGGGAGTRWAGQIRTRWDMSTCHVLMLHR